MKTKAQMKAEYRFNMRIYEELIDLPGARAVRGTLGLAIVIKTAGGLLTLRPDGTCVFGRFGDVDKAVLAYGRDQRLNKHSGKWNVHLNNFQTRIDNIEEAVEAAVSHYMTTLRELRLKYSLQEEAS